MGITRQPKAYDVLPLLLRQNTEHWRNGKLYYKRKQCTYNVNSNARSRNHCCSGKAVRITYSKCVSVTMVIQHAKRMRHIVICGLPPFYIAFTHYLTNGTVTAYKMCVFSFCSNLFETFLVLSRILLNLNFLCSFSNKKKYSNTKFHENPSNGSRVVPCGQTDRRTGG